MVRSTTEAYRSKMPSIVRESSSRLSTLRGRVGSDGSDATGRSSRLASIGPALSIGAGCFAVVIAGWDISAEGSATGRLNASSWAAASSTDAGELSLVF